MVKRRIYTVVQYTEDLLGSSYMSKVIGSYTMFDKALNTISALTNAKLDRHGDIIFKVLLRDGVVSPVYVQTSLRVPEYRFYKIYISELA